MTVILVVMRYRHRKRMAELNTVDDDLAYQAAILYTYLASYYRFYFKFKVIVRYRYYMYQQ